MDNNMTWYGWICKCPRWMGFEALNIIRELPNGADVPILALTASGFAEDQEEILQAGFNGYVRKPYRDTDLLEIMADWLPVRYSYQDTQTHETAYTGFRTTTTELSKLDLATVSEAWRVRLHHAATRGELDQIELLIEEIQPSHPDVAHQLNKLVEEFRFDVLVNLSEARQ